MTNSKGVAVKILGKDYQVSCAEDQTHRLLEASLLLDNKMKAIRSNGRVIGLERIAVMAALNLAHELLTLQASSLQMDENTSKRINVLCEKIDEALGT